MHSSNQPDEEAERLYVAQSDLAGRLAAQTGASDELVTILLAEMQEQGGKEVALPVLAATLTTVIVFFPVTWIHRHRGAPTISE